MFDPWRLKLVKILQKPWRIEYYAPHVIVLRPAPYGMVQKLIVLEELELEMIVVDTGNLAVTMVSIVFMLLC